MDIFIYNIFCICKYKWQFIASSTLFATTMKCFILILVINCAIDHVNRLDFFVIHRK